MYDWANSAFALVIVSSILPIYYSKVAASNLSPQKATIYWSYTIAIAVFLTAMIAPLVGTIADNTRKKKLFLVVSSSIGIVFTSLLYFSGSGRWLYVSVIFVVANIGFAISEIFYNSLLKFITKPEDIDKVSTLGYAFGYLGGGILLGANLLLFHIVTDKSFAARLSFISVALWWGIFSIPLIANVSEPKVKTTVTENYIEEAIRRLITTFKDIKKYKNLFMFLIAFWLYNDGIGTIIKLAAIYGAEIGIGSSALLGALLVTQFVGIPFTILFGRLSSILGTKNSIYVGLLVYTLISVGAFFMKSATHFWILAILVGTVQGGTQALSRSFFGSLVPEEKASEFFSFYGMSSRFAGIMGPLTFAIISQISGSSRIGILCLIAFFITGMMVLSKVDLKNSPKPPLS